MTASRYLVNSNIPLRASLHMAYTLSTVWQKRVGFKKWQHCSVVPFFQINVRKQDDTTVLPFYENYSFLPDCMHEIFRVLSRFGDQASIGYGDCIPSGGPYACLPPTWYKKNTQALSKQACQEEIRRGIGEIQPNLCKMLTEIIDIRLRRSLRAMQLAEKEITIQAPWGKLRGLTWGAQRDPPVFLCHGRMDACSGFRPLVQLLPRCFYYVSVDLPGNGRSDHFPRGPQLNAMDYVPTVKVVKEHFKWDKFIYVGHSLGAMLGKFFNIAYPGHITRMVELDPIPAHEICSLDLEGVRRWYHIHYHSYYEQYGKLNGGGEAPKYTYEKALDLIMEARFLHKKAAEHVLERVVAPAGDGLYRFTHDQRQKTFTRMPWSGDVYRAIYTATTTPTFCVIAQDVQDYGVYDQTPFVKDPACWPNGNYSVKIVEGTHDVHINHPERMAEDVSQFLMKDVRAKM